MSLTRSRLGVVWKLYSNRGTLLGTLTIPHRIAAGLDDPETRHIRFVVMTGRPTAFDFLRNQPATIAPLRTAVIQRDWNHADGVQLHGATLDEIERMDGFAFAPGAGYLRSLME